MSDLARHHAHASVDAQAHAHAHARQPARAPSARSVLALSAGERLLLVVPPIIALWVGVWWALR